MGGKPIYIRGSTLTSSSTTSDTRRYSKRRGLRGEGRKECLREPEWRYAVDTTRRPITICDLPQLLKEAEAYGTRRGIWRIKY